jgi:hypothetical protein
MRQARFFLVTMALLLAAGLGKPADEPLYDEKANASEHVAVAVAQAAKTGKRIVLVFGANW